MVSQEFFLSIRPDKKEKNLLFSVVLHVLLASLKCYVMKYAKSGDLVRKNVGGGVINILLKPHPCFQQGLKHYHTDREGINSGARLSRFKFQLWSFTGSLSTIPNST